MTEIFADRSDDTLVTCFFKGPPAPCGSGTEPPTPVRPTSSPIPHPRFSVASVSLRLLGRRIVLHSGYSFVLGRQRTCDIVSPQAAKGDDAARRRSLKVSRRHCMILRTDSGWCVRDGEGDGRSSFGTWWNGEILSAPVAFGTVPGMLSLGGPSAVDSVAFDVCVTGASLLLALRPDAAESHVLLGGETPLDVADAQLAGFFTFFADGAFHWHRGSDRGVFVPGTRLSGIAGDFWVE